MPLPARTRSPYWQDWADKYRVGTDQDMEERGIKNTSQIGRWSAMGQLTMEVTF
jgi:hypothetical protein